MKTIFKTCIFLTILAGGVSIFHSCQTTLPVEKVIYIPVQDTISERENIATIIRLEYDLANARDSLSMLTDSLGEDLVVAKIKLARIKEYNRIAGKGNNIKYLRGWINRVLKDE